MMIRSNSGCRRYSLPTLGLTLLLASSAAHAGGLATPVVGGTAAKPGDWPDVVAVLAEDGGVCTGTLLGADLVVTAGHCIGSHPVEVVVGSVDIARAGGQRRAVKWSKAYPRWDSRYDVGVVMLEHPVHAKQRAVAEHCTTGKRNRLTPGTHVELVGFGLTTTTATDDNTRLHAATIEVVDGLCEHDEACKQAIAPGGEFIAGGNGVDACFGDSGGPVYIGTASGPALVGIVSRGLPSWSEPCGDGGVFVRADKVVAWIEEVTGRSIDRVECDVPADAGDDGTAEPSLPTEDGGACHAGGLMGSGASLVYGWLCLGYLRRARIRRRRMRQQRGTTRQPA